MTDNVRWRRPQSFVRAFRKLRAKVASSTYSRAKNIPPEPFEVQRDISLVAPLGATVQSMPVPVVKSGRKLVKTIIKVGFLCLLALGAWWAYREMRTSELQAHFFGELASKVKFTVQPGPSPMIRYPKDSPYDARLGYASLPEFFGKLRAKDFVIRAQARVSPGLIELTDMGLFPPYPEKTQVGLAIFDCRKQPLFSAAFPERMYGKFDEAPILLIKSLLFIENRELLDPTFPKRNPAVEWDRLAKAVLEQALHGFSGEHKTSGGSTLATQIEKYRHSPDGRTASSKDKLRQMVSATLRAYQQGEDTSVARRQIVIDYLNTVPLSAKPGYGEVNGIGDGMWVWYGRDFAEVNRLLHGLHADGGIKQVPADPVRSAQIYKEALSLLIAQRRPSYYLGDSDDDLDELTNSHLRLLANAGVIPTALRDAALKINLNNSYQPAPAASGAPLAVGGNGVAPVAGAPRVPAILPSALAMAQSAQPVQPGIASIMQSANAPMAQPVALPASSFVTRKATNAVRTHLAGLLGDSRLYNLDRFDLTVASTLDAQAQKAVTGVLRDLRDGAIAKSAGLTGKGLLGNGDPASVVYSFTLLERGDNANYLRIQTDNYDQPLDINEGAKLDLGSTAKLRTTVTYLDIVDQLHKRLADKDAEQLSKIVVDPKDAISRWALDYLKHATDKSLSAMLEAALERHYSAGTGERFFTGGGMHTFGNFRREDNGSVMSVRHALRNSVNLVFVRLLRDVVHYYMFQTPGSSASLLQDADDPRRKVYLSRFADREGREFINRFYPKYKGKNLEQAEQALLQSVHPTPSRLAAIYRTIAPTATQAQFDAFVKANLPSQNEADPAKLARYYQQFEPSVMSLADRGFIAHVHPLELWVVGFMRSHPGANLSQVVAASAAERQEVYQWLFKTHRKHAQDRRIAGLLEVEGFLEIHRQWKRMGYPFDSLVPSYATALGASADRPAALAELMGIIVNEGLRKPNQRVDTLHFAKSTPYETLLERAPGKSEQVLAKEVAQAVAGVIREVVADGTAKRVKNAFIGTDGKVILVGGKTGTGDQRFDVYGAGGHLIESRFVNRSATFVFNIGQRFFGSITAYVHGPQAANYDFTSALPVQLLKVLAPSIMPLIEPGGRGPEQFPSCGAARRKAG